jgi:hypothetical protein
VERTTFADWPAEGPIDLAVHDPPHRSSATEWWYVNTHVTTADGHDLSLFAAVVSVAAHDVADPDVWFYNPAPPVEFGAHGLDVDVAWRGGTRIRATGNSFAAPHLSGRAALIRAEHPDASPFEVSRCWRPQPTTPT